jgi:hypothetical protein
MDEDGYPEPDVIETIEKWDIQKQSVTGLIDLIEANWWGGDVGGLKRKKTTLELHCFGWSGNEEIIDALRRTKFPSFYGLFWWKEITGGHYYFRNIKEFSEVFKKEKDDDIVIVGKEKIQKMMIDKVSREKP